MIINAIRLERMQWNKMFRVLGCRRCVDVETVKEEERERM
jgi:hypothetical protein